MSIALMAIGASMIFVGAVSADQADALHCPAGWLSKDDSGADDNDVVPAPGLRICVKAGSPSSNEIEGGNTGIIVSDGESTLREYLFRAGIVDGSGTRGRDVSYWVTYEALPSEEPSQLPSEEPSVPASQADSEAPSQEPSQEPSVVPSETGGVLPGNPTPTPGQLPDTSAGLPGLGLSVLGLATMLAGSVLGLASTAVRRRR